MASRMEAEASASYRTERCVRGVELDITSSMVGDVVTVVAYDKSRYKRYKLHLCVPHGQAAQLESAQVRTMLVDLAERTTLSFPTDKSRARARGDGDGEDGNGNGNGDGDGDGIGPKNGLGASPRKASRPPRSFFRAFLKGFSPTDRSPRSPRFQRGE